MFLNGQHFVYLEPVYIWVSKMFSMVG